jgi:hypothetical protein
MIKSDFRDAVKLESRIAVSDDLDTLIDNVVADILTDIGNKARFHEVYFPDSPIALTDAIGTYNLPAGYQNLNVLDVRFRVGPGVTDSYRVLKEMTPVIMRTANRGLPFYFFLSSGLQINLFPFESILATHTFFVSFYKNPSDLFLIDSDPFPIPRLEGTVKKEAIARVARYHEALQLGQVMSQDASSSLVSSRSAS